MSVKIQGIVIRYEGDAAGASELLRSITGLISQTVTPVADQPSLEPTEAPALPQPMTAPPRPQPLCKRAFETIEVPVRKKPGPKPKNALQTGKVVATVTDGARFAPEGSALQVAIEDHVRLHGPTKVRDLAVAMQRAGQAIGKAVSTSDRLIKDDDGNVIVLNTDD
jgi:hypothetical protein